jgi:PAS domain S-box-containing protein
MAQSSDSESGKSADRAREPTSPSDTLDTRSGRLRKPARVSAYIEAALDCIIIADRRGRIVEFNPAAERTFGYTRQAALGRALAELIVPAWLRERHNRAFARFVESGESRLLGRRLELTAMRADRSEFPVELTLSRVEGEPLLVCGALRDITESKRAADDLRRLADEQAALRRVATLIARGATPANVFAAVAEEIAHVLDVPQIGILRYDTDGYATEVGGWTKYRELFPVGTRWTLAAPSGLRMVAETGRPARIYDYPNLPGAVAERVREAAMRSGVGIIRCEVAVPITISGALWGAVVALSTDPQPWPAATEERLARFTELVATAISNAEATDELTLRLHEQAALRRVATRIASGAEPSAVFDAVCEETSRLIDATHVNLVHFTPDGFNVTIAGWSVANTHVPTGTRARLEGENINVLIQQSGEPARFDAYDSATGELAEIIRGRGIRSEIGAPVTVDGRPWGALIAGWDNDDRAPEAAETRLADFAELIAMAVSNATTRAELIASRARIITAADEARRRIERDLHDGTQQQLVSLALELQLLEAEIPASLPNLKNDVQKLSRALDRVLENVRDISHGVHPAILYRGLGPALRALARRSTVRTKLAFDVANRLPQAIEIAVYYVVSEALANVAKHANASVVRIEVTATKRKLHATIVDDGVGGADASQGSGLTGLFDRVEALGGHFLLASPRGGGTTISLVLPLHPEPFGDSLTAR